MSIKRACLEIKLQPATNGIILLFPVLLKPLNIIDVSHLTQSVYSGKHDTFKPIIQLLQVRLRASSVTRFGTSRGIKRDLNICELQYFTSIDKAVSAK